MSIEAFRDQTKTALASGDKDAVFALMTTFQMPEGWQDQVDPFLEMFAGHELVAEMRPVEEFSRAELRWKEGELAPELAAVEQILVISWEEGEPGSDGYDQGRFTFPVTNEEGHWRILLTGGA